MTRFRIVLIIAALVCGACGGGSPDTTEARSVEPIITQVSPGDPTRTRDPSESLKSPSAVPTVSAEYQPVEGCPFTRADRLDRVVALAIDGLENTTSKDGWSRACAQVRGSHASEEPYLVTVRIGWMGTLREFASISSANPIVGVADEAYSFGAGRQIALRSGELVAVVSYAGPTPSGTEAWARQVAEQLRE
jgi:hypothetical protein